MLSLQGPLLRSSARWRAGSGTARHRLLAAAAWVLAGALLVLLVQGHRAVSLAVTGAGALVTWRLNARSRARARTAEARFRLSFDNAPIGMAVVELDGRFTEVNAALCEIVGRGAGELRAMTFHEITHPDDHDADLGLLCATLEGERRSFQLRKRYLHADGHGVWINLSVSVVLGDDGAPQHLIAQMEDITERHKAEAELQFLADHDGLTGLLNRRRFEEELERHAALAERYGDETALLVLDLDHFKSINDSLGHAAGDAVLKGVAEILRRRTRSTDVVARLGGDEFALLLMRAAADQAETVAADIASAVRGWQDFYGEQPLSTTTSIGVAVLGERVGEDPELALRRADAAMYAAKAAGRDGLVVA